MALITLPTIGAASVHPRLIRGDVPLEKMGGSVVVVAPPYAVWTLSIPLGTLKLADARAWFAALAQLSKLSNTCKVMPPGYPGPGTGYAGPAPLVLGAGQLGTSLNADGVTPNAAIALAGDFMEVNGEFKILTANATANGAGQVTFVFESALRAAPADNAAIDIATPKITCRLAQPVAEWEYRRTSLRHDITLDLIESF
jgi:hypothetical protein